MWLFSWILIHVGSSWCQEICRNITAFNWKTKTFLIQSVSLVYVLCCNNCRDYTALFAMKNCFQKMRRVTHGETSPCYENNGVQTVQKRLIKKHRLIFLLEQLQHKTFYFQAVWKSIPFQHLSWNVKFSSLWILSHCCGKNRYFFSDTTEKMYYFKHNKLTSGDRD